MLKKLRKMLKKQEGFTLVELMIVVVILGILAGIGVQQYANVQQRAKKAADEAQRLRTEVLHLKDQIESLKAQLQELSTTE